MKFDQNPSSSFRDKHADGQTQSCNNAFILCNVYKEHKRIWKSQISKGATKRMELRSDFAT